MVPTLEHAWCVHGLTQALTHSTQKGLPAVIKLDAMTAWRGSTDEFMKLRFPSQFLGSVAHLVWRVVRVIFILIKNIGHFGVFFIFIKKSLSFFVLFHRSRWRKHMIVLLLFLIDSFSLYLSRRRLPVLHGGESHGAWGLSSSQGWDII